MIGIDISKHNGNIDFSQVIPNIDFAILRVGYGVSYLPDSQKDKMFESYYNSLKGQRPLGAYYYSYANEIGEGKKEAENCLKYLGNKTLELPIYYDLEDKTMANINEVAREFIDTIKEAGYKPGIYCNLDWAKHKVDLSRFQDCSIWIAMYGTNTGNIPSNKPSVNYNIWQYTSKGHIPGINGYVDMNIADEIPIPTPEPEPTPTGDRQIREIQEWLNNEYGAGLTVDGDYGPKTHKALVKALQHELNVQYGAGLVEDGIFGPRTKAKCPNVRKGARGNITKLIQAMLYCKGYNTNGVDGIFESGTDSAVRKFQKNNKLTADGIVGKNTFEKLFK